jgi:hypothetical protein
MTSYGVRALLALLPIFGLAGPGQAAPITQQMKDACAADYRKHCPDYGLESAALRLCMDKAGAKLSKSCVSALVRAGQVSQAEVNRRKKAGK